MLWYRHGASQPVWRCTEPWELAIGSVTAPRCSAAVNSGYVRLTAPVVGQLPTTTGGSYLSPATCAVLTTNTGLPAPSLIPRSCAALPSCHGYAQWGSSAPCPFKACRDGRSIQPYHSKFDLCLATCRMQWYAQACSAALCLACMHRHAQHRTACLIPGLPPVNANALQPMLPFSCRALHHRPPPLLLLRQPGRWLSAGQPALLRRVPPWHSACW